MTERRFSPLQSLYREGGVSEKRIRSMRFFLAGTILGTVFSTIVNNGTMLAGYFAELGGSAFAFGILNAIPFVAAVCQIPASIMVNRSGARKKSRILYGLIARSVWILIGLIPFFIPMNPLWMRLCGLCVLRGVSAVCEAFPEVTYGSWLADLVPRNIRGRWLAVRDIVCGLAEIGIGLALAWLTGMLPGLAGYTIVFVLSGLIGIADMLCYLKVEDIPMPEEGMKQILPVIRQIGKDREFLRFMAFWAIWLFTAYMASPYTNFYALTRLGLSISAVTVGGQVIPAVMAMLVSPFWGRQIDRRGNKWVMFLSCTLAALAPSIFVFAREGQGTVFFLYNLLGSMVWSVPFLASLNMMLCNSPYKDRTSYVAIFHSFTELCGSFPGVLLGGTLIDLLARQMPRLTVLQGSLVSDEYKMVFVLSTILRLAAVFLFVPGLHDRKE